MVQRSKDAAVKDAQIELRREECARGMGQRSNDAALKDVQIMLNVEDCASSMEQRGQRGNAAAKDVQIMLSKEEYARDMVRNQVSNIAPAKDVQIMPSVEEYVEGTGQTAIHTMNLLLSDQSTRRLLQLKPYPISVLLELPSEDKKKVAFPER
jgi:hypothetical protein